MTVTINATSSGRQLYSGQPSGVPTVANPATAPTLSASGTGGTLPATTYYVKYTWITSVGETVTSPESTGQAVTAGQTLTVTLPTFPSGVTKANVYISSSTGTETLQGSTTSTTFTQSTPLVTGIIPPTVNTTGATALYTAKNYTTNVTSDSGATSGNSGTGSATVYVKEINTTNVSSATANYSLFIVPAGGIACTTTAYHYNIPVAVPTNGGDAKTFSGINAMMPAGSTLQAVQSVAGALTLTISGVEVQ